jgi:hypothetical protein
MWKVGEEVRSRAIEAAVIGVLAGGWASRTFWPGVSGIFIGTVVFILALIYLTIQREEEQKQGKKPYKHASPYKNA